MICSQNDDFYFSLHLYLTFRLSLSVPLLPSHSNIDRFDRPLNYTSSIDFPQVKPQNSPHCSKRFLLSASCPVHWMLPVA